MYKRQRLAEVNAVSEAEKNADSITSTTRITTVPYSSGVMENQAFLSFKNPCVPGMTACGVSDYKEADPYDATTPFHKIKCDILIIA